MCRMTRKICGSLLARVALCSSLTLAAVGCEDDPMDLDYLKDAGAKDAGEDAGGGTDAATASDAGQDAGSDAAGGDDAGDDAGGDAG